MGILRRIVELLHGVTASEYDELERMLSALHIQTSPPDPVESGLVSGRQKVEKFFTQDARIHSMDETVGLLSTFFKRPARSEIGAVYAVGYVPNRPPWKYGTGPRPDRERGRIDISYDHSGEARQLLVEGGPDTVLVIRVSEDGFKGCIHTKYYDDDFVWVSDLDE